MWFWAAIIWDFISVDSFHLNPLARTFVFHHTEAAVGKMAGSVTYSSWIRQAKLDRGCLLHIHFPLTSLMIRGQWAEGNNFIFLSPCANQFVHSSRFRFWPEFKPCLLHMGGPGQLAQPLQSLLCASARFFRGLRAQCTQCSVQCSSETLAWWLLWSPPWSWHIFKPNDLKITLISFNVKLVS